MPKQYLKIGYRRLLRYKTNSIINIIGLSIAITVCIIIFLFSFYHLSFDRYVENEKNSFRLISRFGDGTYNSNTFACFSDILTEFPEVEKHTSCFIVDNISDVIVNEKKININEAIYVNTSFFDFFSVDILEGVKESMGKPNTMMVTPDVARKLYGNASPVGKTVLVRPGNQDSLISFTISGIVKPFPKTSHIGYEILLSQKGNFWPGLESVKRLKNFSIRTYLKLLPNSDVKKLETKLSEKAGIALENAFGPPVGAFNHHLQPLRDIHFSTNVINEQHPTIRLPILNILLLVGIVIFAIASINFLNMYIAKFEFHRKESGIIRFLGGTMAHSFGNIFTETFLMISFSFILSFLLLVIFNSFITNFLFINWTINFSSFSFWLTVTGVYFGAIIFITVLAFFNFRGFFKNPEQKLLLSRNRRMVSLVISQFVIVIGLIGFTFLVNKQLQFIKNKSLGFDPENVIVIRMPQQTEKVSVFRDELKKSAFIINASSVQHYPGFRLEDMNFSNNGLSFPFKFAWIDQYAIQTLKIKPVKYFSPACEKATDGWLINKTFYNRLREKYTDDQIALGNFPEEVTMKKDPNRSKFIILGVIEDFNYESLHTPIENFAFSVRTEPVARRFVLARFGQSGIREVIKTITDKMETLFPGQPVNYSFLDEQLNAQYASEQTLMKLINSFSLVAIFVACIGLIGLSVFIMEIRTKEIGIRKINGANTSEIIMMLNTNFIKWIVVAFIISCPIAWYVMNKWLQNFAYKTELSWWIFAAAGAVAVIVAVITVSWQSLRAATRNPVEALRYE